jgi:hypothetical protein
MEGSNIPVDYYHGSSDYPKTGRGTRIGETKFVPVEDITEGHLPEGWGTKSPEELLEEAEEAWIEGVGGVDNVDPVETEKETEGDSEGVVDGDDGRPRRIGIRKMAILERGLRHDSVDDKRQDMSHVRGKNNK